MTPTQFCNFLDDFGACPPAIRFARRFEDPQEAWENTEKLSWLVWLAYRMPGIPMQDAALAGTDSARVIMEVCSMPKHIRHLLTSALEASELCTEDMSYEYRDSLLGYCVQIEKERCVLKTSTSDMTLARLSDRHRLERVMHSVCLATRGVHEMCNQSRAGFPRSHTCLLTCLLSNHVQSAIDNAEAVAYFMPPTKDKLRKVILGHLPWAAIQRAIQREYGVPADGSDIKCP